MSKARGLADLGNVYDDGALSNRNLIINSAMQVAQRGTSFTGVTSIGYYACDRWNIPMSGAGTWTITQSTDAPDGFANSLKLECTTANASLSANAFIYPRYQFEGQDVQQLKKGTSSAESITVSFWVKSNKTGTYHVGFQDGDNNRLRGEAYTISTSETWEYKTVTVDGDTTGALNNDSGASLQLHFWIAAGSTYTNGGGSGSWAAVVNGNYGDNLDVNIADTVGNYWQITGVQLEVGDTATPFEHPRSFADELARCQRYYYKPTNLASTNRYCILQARVVNGGNYNHTFTLPVPMRASPTFNPAIGSTSGFDGSTLNAGDLSNQTGRVYCTANSNNDAGFYYYSITADAEL